jgi:tetratricopeptide (TPR) repeat protein
MNQHELQRLRDLGQYYLQTNNISLALKTYAAILEMNPEDIGSLVIIGDSYLTAGFPEAAKELYQNALVVDQDRKDLIHRLNLAEKTVSLEERVLEGYSPLNPLALDQLIEKLTGKPATIDEDKLQRAAEILEKTIHSDSPAASVSENLDEIDALLPAIIELNIRQARSDGNIDLSAQLVDLQHELITKANDPQAYLKKTGQLLEIGKGESEKPKVLLFGSTSMISPFRQKVIGDALRHANFRVEEDLATSLSPWEGKTAVVAHNPHLSPTTMKNLAACSSAGLPILVDMDFDFRALSNGTTSETRAFTAAIQLADIITFPTAQTALKVSTEGFRSLFVPDGWSRSNSLWLKEGPQSARFNIGLFVENGRKEDAALIRRAVIRILREYPQTRLVICGDPEVYSLFDSIPDTRRIFLPIGENEDYPFLLAQTDIHLFPGSDSPEYQMLSDRRCMESGIRKTVWIASPNPAIEEWQVGGFIARSSDDWYTHIKTIISDPDIVLRMAQEGHFKSLEREAAKISRLWSAVLQKTIMARNSETISGGGI